MIPHTTEPKEVAMKHGRTVLLAALAALCWASPAAAQVIFGKVLDATTGQPVAEATVEALRENNRPAGRVRSQADGTFVLEIQAGSYRLQAARVGYQTTTSQPMTIEMREQIQLDLRISTSEVLLDPLTVTTRTAPPRIPSLERNGFYERERQGIGAFLTREEIVRRNPLNVTDIFRGVSGIRVVPAGGTRYVITMIRSGRECVPRMFLDNMPMSAAEMETMLRPEHIAAIEVYRGASEIPARYGGNRSSCGVVLIWTRIGDR